MAFSVQQYLWIIICETNACNLSSSSFRCTLTNIPQTQALLNKAKLPLGLLLHPFRDLTVKFLFIYKFWFHYVKIVKEVSLHSEVEWNTGLHYDGASCFCCAIFLKTKIKPENKYKCKCICGINFNRTVFKISFGLSPLCLFCSIPYLYWLSLIFSLIYSIVMMS